MNTHKISCDECQKILASSVTKCLSPKKNPEIEMHLVHCKVCARIAEEYQTLAAQFKIMECLNISPDPGFRSKWTSLIIQEAPQQGHNAVAQDRFEMDVFYQKLVNKMSFFLHNNLRPLSVVVPTWLCILIFHLSSPKVEITSQKTPNLTANDIVRIFQTHDNQELFGQRTEKSRSTGMNKPVSYDYIPSHLKARMLYC